MDAMSKSLDFSAGATEIYLEISKVGRKREKVRKFSPLMGNLISSFFHFEHPHALLYIAGPAGMLNKHKDPSFDNMVERNINIHRFFLRGAKVVETTKPNTHFVCWHRFALSNKTSTS